jgi:hypothetical protein
LKNIGRALFNVKFSLTRRTLSGFHMKEFAHIFSHLLIHLTTGMGINQVAA